MRNKILYNKVSWESIKSDCKYPEIDNNDGFIYGIEISEDKEVCIDILDYQWFKTEEERDNELSALQHENISK